MNTSNRSNPILVQIPLLVAPGKYAPPRSVNLPYDFVKLPESVPGEFMDDLHATQDRLELLLNQQTEAQDRLAYLYSEDIQSERIKPYNDWKTELNKMAPGYFGSKMSVMAPTVNRPISSLAPESAEEVMNVDDIGEEQDAQQSISDESQVVASDIAVSHVSQELSGLQI